MDNIHKFDIKNEFILKFYESLQSDQKRFLSFGIETITSLVGFVAIISLGFSGDLPFLVSIIIGIIILGWCWGNIIESNYLTLKTLVQIANIESLFLEKNDSNAFSRYTGYYPRFHTLGCLKNQILLIISFLIMDFLLYLNKIFMIIYEAGFITVVKETNIFIIYYHLLPFCLIFLVIKWIMKKYEIRAGNYKKFLTDYEGPGVVVSERKILEKNKNSEEKNVNYNFDVNVKLSNEDLIKKLAMKIKKYNKANLKYTIWGSLFLLILFTSVILLKQAV